MVGWVAQTLTIRHRSVQFRRLDIGSTFVSTTHFSLETVRLINRSLVSDTSFWRSQAKLSVEELAKRKQNTNTAKNLIIFLGDGMSIPTLAATRVYLGNENQHLSFDKFPGVGLSKVGILIRTFTMSDDCFHYFK